MDRENKKKCILLASFIGVTLGIYALFKYIVPLVAPFIIAVIIAFAIKKPVEFIHKKMRINKGFATILVIGVIAFFLFFLVGYLLKMLLREISLLSENYEIYYNAINDKLSKWCGSIDSSMGLEKGASAQYVRGYIDEGVSSLQENVLPSIMEKSLGIVIGVITALGVIIITVVATVLIAKDLDKILNDIKESAFAKEFRFVSKSIGNIIGVYLKTQGIIMLITAVICIIGLFLIKNPYAMLIGILIGFLDALPIFGTGAVLIPWSVYYVIDGDYYKAAVIFSIYCICYFSRQYLEPKLMGGKLGASPIIMLVSIYAGFMLFSFWGFIFGPVAYILIKDIMKEIKTKI